MKNAPNDLFLNSISQDLKQVHLFPKPIRLNVSYFDKQGNEKTATSPEIKVGETVSFDFDESGDISFVVKK